MPISRFQRHIETAIDDLPSQFKDKPNIEAILRVVGKQINETDDALCDLFFLRLLDTATSDSLKQIAKRLLVVPGSDDDALLRARCKAEIRLNRSSGTVDDVLEVLSLVLGEEHPIGLTQLFPASFIVEILETDIATTLADLIERARVGGVGAQLVYSDKAEEAVFVFASGDAEEASTTQGTAEDDDENSATGGCLAGVIGA